MDVTVGHITGGVCGSSKQRRNVTTACEYKILPGMYTFAVNGNEQVRNGHVRNGISPRVVDVAQITEKHIIERQAKSQQIAEQSLLSCLQCFLSTKSSA